MSYSSVIRGRGPAGAGGHHGLRSGLMIGGYATADERHNHYLNATIADYQGVSDTQGQQYSDMVHINAVLLSDAGTIKIQ